MQKNIYWIKVPLASPSHPSSSWTSRTPPLTSVVLQQYSVRPNERPYVVTIRIIYIVHAPVILSRYTGSAPRPLTKGSIS